MKIAILSYYSGVVDRGVETFAYEIGKRLARNNKTTIFAAGHIKPEKFEVKIVKAFAKPPHSQKGILGKFYIDLQSFKILFFTVKLLPLLVKHKYDLIIPLNGGWQVVIIRLFSKMIRSKMLVSGHAGIGSDDAWNILWRPDVFVALTTAQANWAKKLTPEVKITVIPNGVDLHKFNPKVEQAKIDLQKPIVVCASALVRYKRVDLTIRAIAKTKNLSLLVLGDGELRGAIDSLGKRLLGQRYLRLTVPYPKIASYYRTGKVFTLASSTEAFGISYVEAMACNLPVVTQKDSSRTEIINGAGVMVNTANLNRYAKALSYAARSNFKNKPYAQALNFSWNKIAERYLRLISKINTT